MLFNILKIATLLCASSAFVKAAPLEGISDVVTREDDALSQLADQIIALHPPAYNVSTTAPLETRDDLFVNCGCAKSGIKYWHADMDTVIAALGKGGDIWFQGGEARFFDPRSVGSNSKIGFYMKNPHETIMQLIPGHIQRLVTLLKEKRDRMLCGRTGYNIYCQLAFVDLSFYVL